MIIKNKNAQVSLENTLLIVIVIGALLATAYYFKRSIQGRWKAALEDMSAEQYDPSEQQTEMHYYVESNTITNLYTTPASGGFWTRRQDLTNSYEGKWGETAVIGGAGPSSSQSTSGGATSGGTTGGPTTGWDGTGTPPSGWGRDADGNPCCYYDVCPNLC